MSQSESAIQRQKSGRVKYLREATMGAAAKVAPIVILAYTCGGCGQLKSPAEYSANKRNAWGLQSQCKDCNSKWQKEHPEKRRDTWRRYRRDHYMEQKYGLTFEQYWVIFDLQDGRCAVCRRTAEEAGMEHSVQQLPLHVDHCHDSNEVRGLLCRYCNQGLGSFGDDVERLRRAVAYLELDRAVTVTG